MTLPRLTVLFPAVPSMEIHLIGRLVPAGPMSLLAMTLLLLPTILVPLAVVVLNRIFPAAVPGAAVAEPRIVQLATTLFCAPPAAAVLLMNRIVLVPAVEDTVVFDSVS